MFDSSKGVLGAPAAAGNRARPKTPGSAAPSLEAITERARPISSTKSQLLQVLPPLTQLLPDGGLRRGSSITVTAGSSGGALSLALALAAVASASGSWGALVGVADPGALAMHQIGVDLSRWVLVPDPGIRWAETVAKLLDDIDLIVLQPPRNLRPQIVRRLVTRTRERRCVLIAARSHLNTGRSWWPEPPDTHLHVEAAHWEGADNGNGYLRRRRLTVSATGRRAATREVRTDLWLPSQLGTVDQVGAAGE